MAVVPRYDEQRVESRPVSGVKVTNTPDDGAGMVADAIGGVGQLAGQVGRDMQEDVDAAKLTEVFAGASDRIRQVMQEDILARKGEQAFDADKEVDKIHADIARESKAGLRNDRQKAAFDGLWARQREGNLNSTYRHIAGEKELYKQNAAIVGAKAAIDDVAADYDSPDDVARHIERGRKFTVANLQGQDPEVIKQAEEGFISEAHATVIDRLVIADPGRAQEYYKNNKKQIGGLQRDRIEKLIKDETLRSKSQEATDKIMATIKEPEKQLAAARKLSGDMEDAVVRRVKERQNEEKAAKNRIKTDLVEEASKIIVQGGKLDDLKPEHREALGVTGIDSMRRFIASNTSGIKLTLNSENAKIYYDLLDMSIKNPQQFLDETERLAAMIGVLPPEEIGQIDRLRRSIKKGETKDTTIGGTYRQIATDAFTATGLDKKHLPLFRQELRKEAELRGIKEGEKGWRDEVQAAADYILIKGEYEKGIKLTLNSENAKIYYDLLDMSIKNPQQFLDETERLSAMIGVLPPKEIGQIDKLRRSIKEGETKDTAIGGTYRQIATDAFTASKLDKKHLPLFRQELREEVELRGIKEDEKGWRDEVQAAADYLLIKGEWIKSGKWYDPDIRRFQSAVQDGDGEFAPDEEPTDVANIREVPESEIEKIKAAFSRKGMAPSDDQIAEIYNKKLSYE